MALLMVGENSDACIGVQCQSRSWKKGLIRRKHDRQNTHGLFGIGRIVRSVQHVRCVIIDLEVEPLAIEIVKLVGCALSSEQPLACLRPSLS